MYFQRIGASGYALGGIKVKSPPVAQGFWLRYASFVDGLREGIDKRIRAVAGGDHGSIGSQARGPASSDKEVGGFSSNCRRRLLPFALRCRSRDATTAMW